MESQTPQVHTEVECPVLKQKREVNLEINVFRGADRGGVEVTACSEFLHGKGKVSCGQGCTHTDQARDIHATEVAKHQQELGQIGGNVIG